MSTKVATLFLAQLGVLVTLCSGLPRDEAHAQPTLGCGIVPAAASTDHGRVAGGMSPDAHTAGGGLAAPNQNSSGKPVSCTAARRRSAGQQDAGARTYQVGAPARSGSDNAQIQSTIDDAIADLQAGKARSAAILLQPNATYHLSSSPTFYDALKISTYGLPKRPVADMSRQYANLFFNGRGATLSLSGTTAGIYMNGCQDCVVENLTIVTDPDPMVGGVVTAVSLADRTADAALVAGATFSLPAGYSRGVIVGKNNAAAMFRVPEARAFPDHYKLVSFIPYLAVAAADPVSGRTQRFGFTTFNTGILSRLPAGKATLSSWNPGLDPAKALYLWGPGGHVLPQAILAAAPTRQRYPQYPWTFFTGRGISALYFEQNTGLTVRNITIYDFPGVGIHAQGNRGALTFDRIRILAKSPLLLGAASDGMDLEGNQRGPRVTNSVIQNTADDELNIYSPAPFVSAGRVTGASAQLSYSFYALAAQTVLPGDRFRILDSATGNSLGSYTAISVAPLCLAKSQANAFSVTFDKVLPAAAADPSTAFVDLDQVGSGADIENNLFVGGERNGIVVSSSATIKNNLFVGLGLRAVSYAPFAPQIPGMFPRGIWGDFGLVDVAANTSIDNWKFLEIANLRNAGDYAVPTASIRVTGNAIYRSYEHTFTLTNRFPLNIVASGNAIFTSTDDRRQTVDDFLVTVGGAASAPLGTSLQRVDRDTLWNSECAAAKAWFLCSADGGVRFSPR
jgi:hypothetical protein